MTAPEILTRLETGPLTAERKQKCLRLCQRMGVSSEAVLALLTPNQRAAWESF